jgi:hypothetical protein
MKYGYVHGVIEYGKMELSFNAPSRRDRWLGAGFIVGQRQKMFW